MVVVAWFVLLPAIFVLVMVGVVLVRVLSVVFVVTLISSLGMLPHIG